MDRLSPHVCPDCGTPTRVPFSTSLGFQCDHCHSRFDVIIDKATETVVLVRPQIARGVEPLGLPRGSIRALIALLLAGTSWALILLGRDLPLDLFTLLLMVVGYYFGYRVRAKDAGDRFLDPQAVVERPLYLPAGTIRLALILGFAVSAIVLARRHGFELADNVRFFVILMGLIVGHLFARIMRRIASPGLHVAVKHGKGVLGLAATLAVVVLFLAGLSERPDVSPLAVTLVCSVVSFYFGART